VLQSGAETRVTFSLLGLAPGKPQLPLLGSGVHHPSEEQKDTQDNVSHKARFISSQLGSGCPPDAVGLNEDPEYKTQAAFIFFRH
jgi:hypothetical protein